MIRRVFAVWVVIALLIALVVYVQKTDVETDCGMPSVSTPALLHTVDGGAALGDTMHDLIEGGASPWEVYRFVKAAGHALGKAAGVLGLGKQSFRSHLNGQPEPTAVTGWRRQIASDQAAALAACCPVQNPLLNPDDPATPPDDSGSQPWDPKNASFQKTRTTSRDKETIAADALRQAGFPESQIANGIGVGMGESSLNWNAINRKAGGNWGWLQINSVHRDLLNAGNWRDPYDNAEMAYSVWDAAAGQPHDGRGSWQPWSAWPESQRLNPDTVPGAPLGSQPGVNVPALPNAGVEAATPGIRPVTPPAGCPLPNVSGTSSPIGATIGGKPGLVAELNPVGDGNWQGAVQSGSNWFVGQSMANGMAVWHRLNAAGIEVDSMQAVRGVGHQTGFAVINGTVWTDWAGQVVTFPYRPGTTVTRSQVKATGWRGEVSADPSRASIVIRNGNRYQAFNVATRQQIGQTIRTSTGTRQGFSMKGDALYVLTGATNQPARIDTYSFTTGDHTGTQDVTGVGYRDGEDPQHSDYREPEGMYGDLFGVKVFTGKDRRLRVFRLAPPAATATAVSATAAVVSVKDPKSGKTYRVPIPAGKAGVAIRFALQQVGDPYVWAAHGPNAWDCSGLTAGAWKAAGVIITAQSSAQNRTLAHVQSAKPGDILWHPGHVQLFLGVIDGKPTVVEAANPRAGVRIDSSGWMKAKSILRPTEGAAV